MLKMIAGAKINDPSDLMQAYEVSGNQIIANVDVDNIPKVLENFIDFNRNSPLFLFIEVPANLKDEKVSAVCEDGFVTLETHHKDVYYLDGITADKLKRVLESFSEILINDGLSSFGVGNPYGEEIGKYKYNNMILFSRDNPGKYIQIFEQEGITKTENLITAWDTFTYETPGTSNLYNDSAGKNIYDVIEKLYEIGLYKAEQREE